MGYSVYNSTTTPWKQLKHGILVAIIYFSKFYFMWTYPSLYQVTEKDYILHQNKNVLYYYKISYILKIFHYVNRIL